MPTKSPISNLQSPILTPVGFRGLSGWCTGWAGDEVGTVYAWFIGRKTALTAIWAAFQDNEVLKLLPPERRPAFIEGPVEGLLRRAHGPAPPLSMPPPSDPASLSVTVLSVTVIVPSLL